MRRRELLPEWAKRRYLEELDKSGISPEAFLRDCLQRGIPLPFSALALRRWRAGRGLIPSRYGPSRFEEEPHLHLSLAVLIAVALFSVFNRRMKGRKRCATYVHGKVSKLPVSHTLRQVKYRLSTLTERISGLSDAMFDLVSLKLRDARKAVHQRRLMFQIDATLVPARALTGDRKDVTDVWLTIVLDVATRNIMGFQVSWGPPTYGDTIRALLLAIYPSGSWGFVAFGLPWMVQSDNGSIFGPVFTQLLRRLRIFFPKTDPHCPQQNGHIESFNLTLKRLMDFEIETEVEERLPESLELGADALVGIYLKEDILKAIHSALTTYQFRAHRGIKTSPARFWQREWPDEVVRPFNESQIAEAFCVRTEVKVVDGRVRLQDGSILENSLLLAYSDLTLETRYLPAGDQIRLLCGDYVVCEHFFDWSSWQPAVDFDPETPAAEPCPRQKTAPGVDVRPISKPAGVEKLSRTTPAPPPLASPADFCSPQPLRL